MERRIRVFAPATVANLGPGFDVLGLALSTPGDVLEAELSDLPGVEIVEVTGDGGALSLDPQKPGIPSVVFGIVLIVVMILLPTGVGGLVRRLFGPLTTRLYTRS